MKKIFAVTAVLLLLPGHGRADTDLSQRLAGRIVLSVQEKGEAWYINPSDRKRYYLGRPADAFALMKNLGIGISNDDLSRLATGLIDSDEKDSDGDGLPDDLETALGTDPFDPDSDGDGFGDRQEIEQGYDPLSPGKIQAIDTEFSRRHLGKIFIQVERNGEAWYVDPVSQKKYFLSRPAAAWEIMRTFGLGISITDLAKIPVYRDIPSIWPLPQPLPLPHEDTGTSVIHQAASAIRQKNISQAQEFFIPQMERSIEYSLKNLSDESILLLGNLLSGSSLHSSNSKKVTHKNTVFFNNAYHDVYFHTAKQEDGTWKLENL